MAAFARPLRRSTAARLVLGTLLFLAPARPAAADVTDYVGRTIVSVVLREGGRDVRDESLIELIETRVGQALDMRRVRESLLHLFAVGRYEDAQVEATASESGVALVYAVVAVHPVGRVEFEGELGLAEDLLRRSVQDRYGRTPSSARADEMVQTLLQIYRDRGFLGARVTARADVTDAPTETTLVFTVKAGPRALVGSVEIRGTSLLSRAELLERLDLQTGRAYDRVMVDQRLDAYEETLRGRGYYEARADHAATFSPDGLRAVVTLDIDAGPLVSLVFTGDPLPSARRDELVPVRAEGSIDLDLLEDSARRIETYLRGEGHWRAEVDFERRDDEGRTEIRFVVRAGPLYRTGRVEIAGNSTVPLPALQPFVALESGEPFVEEALDASVVAIGEYYRRAGYDGAKVDSAVETSPSAESAAGALEVEPRLVITEGPRTVVATVSFTGNTHVAEADLRPEIGVAPGSPLYRPQLALDRDRVLLRYLNLGYPEATVETSVDLAPDRTRADVVFSIAEGPRVLVDHVLIVGNRSIRSSTIRREVVLETGQPLGLSQVEETQRRLRALGLFRTVRITEITATEDTRRDILITVEESPATSIGYGAGLEGGKRLRRSADPEGGAEERIEFAPRGFFEIGRRNLWGKNRSVNLFTRLSVRPKDDPDDPDAEGLAFNEYRVLGTYREPRAFFADADFTLTGFLEQAIRSSFNFRRQGVHAELLRHFSPTFNASGRYSIEETELFDERYNPEDALLIDRLFPQVRLSTVSFGFARDTRSDALDPVAGALVGIDTRIAGRIIGSEVGFAKTLLQGFMYRRLASERRTVLAFGARLGFARGFVRDVVQVDENGNPIIGPDGEPVTEPITDLPASERFFAGGDTTVRGFALDRLGTDETIDQDGFPTGGNALVVLNSELRFAVWRDIGAVLFLDLGNVFRRVSDLDLSEIRGGTGFGLRYQSPIGPIRVDLGFKLDRKQFDNGERESRTALHVSIGQAF
jgi:outer membrane protein insertion porin family